MVLAHLEGQEGTQTHKGHGKCAGGRGQEPLLTASSQFSQDKEGAEVTTETVKASHQELWVTTGLGVPGIPSTHRVPGTRPHALQASAPCTSLAGPLEGGQKTPFYRWENRVTERQMAPRSPALGSGLGHEPRWLHLPLRGPTRHLRPWAQ